MSDVSAMNTKSNNTTSIVNAIDTINLLIEQIPSGPISIVDAALSDDRLFRDQFAVGAEKGHEFLRFATDAFDRGHRVIKRIVVIAGLHVSDE